jgi:NTP pyrophosphatase (non-canonical NTP hydrolase)
MELNYYQTRSFGTAVYPNRTDKEAVEYTLFGMLGEAGEIANKYKKILRKGLALGPQEKAMLMDEAGDVLWYLAAFVRELGYSLEEVGQFNLDKLSARKVMGELKDHA